MLVGSEAKGLSATVIGRLKREWEAENADWCRRDVAGPLGLSVGGRHLQQSESRATEAVRAGGHWRQ